MTVADDPVTSPVRACITMRLLVLLPEKRRYSPRPLKVYALLSSVIKWGSPQAWPEERERQNISNSDVSLNGFIRNVTWVTFLVKPFGETSNFIIVLTHYEREGKRGGGEEERERVGCARVCARARARARERERERVGYCPWKSWAAGVSLLLL